MGVREQQQLLAAAVQALAVAAEPEGEMVVVGLVDSRDMFLGALSPLFVSCCAVLIFCLKLNIWSLVRCCDVGFQESTV